MRYFVGIDDTDNKTSRGTGFMARTMGHAIEAGKLGIINGITRHQLFFDSRIPYTSQNSSACLVIDQVIDREALTAFCREFLLQHAADGSDVGLCVATPDEIGGCIMDFGLQAKSNVKTMEEAYKLANEKKIHLEGLTGTHVGIIGALSAVGLRCMGYDGRFIWLKGIKELRDLKPGITKVQELIESSAIDEVQDFKGDVIPWETNILLGEWVRPALRDEKAVLLVEKEITEEYEYKSAPKERIKPYTD